MEYKLISTYTFLTSTQCNVIYVTLSCRRGLLPFPVNTAINVALLFPGKKVPLQRKLLKLLLHSTQIQVNTVLS